MNVFRTRLASALSVATLAGCANLSGVGGESTLSCPLPQSGNCKPMSEVYAESVARERGSAPAPASATVPAQPGSAAPAPAAPIAMAAQGEPAAFPIPGLPAPLLTRPRVLRVYIVPWADADGILLEGRRAYVKLDEGQWRLDHFRANERRAYAPIRPPVAAAAAEPAAAPSETNARAMPVNPFAGRGAFEPTVDEGGRR